MSRLTRNRAKRVFKRRKTFPWNRFGTDGPGCPYCCKLNGRFKRETIRGRIAAREIAARE